MGWAAGESYDDERTIVVRYLADGRLDPDFIEVGIEVWENVYDWHVRHQQPIGATRTADGRYVMSVMFTTLILRSDQTNNYIGFGFDAR